MTCPVRFPKKVCRSDLDGRLLALWTYMEKRMNLDKFKHQHLDILDSIAELRKLAHDGVARNAERIARRIVAMSSVIKLHLAVEDKALYPALQRQADQGLAELGRHYQDEMQSIAAAYEGFALRWNTPRRLEQDEAGFRHDANTVLRQVFERMKREDKEFYPRVEALG